MRVQIITSRATPFLSVEEIPNSSNEVIEIIIQAVISTGLKMNQDIMISLDVAATEFYSGHKYNLNGENKILNSGTKNNFGSINKDKKEKKKTLKMKKSPNL